MEIEEHYGQLLGVRSPWEISGVELKINEHRVDIHIEYSDNECPCPECGTVCPKHDDRDSRTWRHLDTMQFATYLHCQLPRARCKAHGVKTVQPLWASKNSRFTLLFESFAIRVLQAARGVEEARKLLKLNWHQVNAITKSRRLQAKPEPSSADWSGARRLPSPILASTKNSSAPDTTTSAAWSIWTAAACSTSSKNVPRWPARP